MFNFSNVICITNRKLVKTNFDSRIKEIALQKPRAIILREKDLTEKEYLLLAKNIKEICEKMGVLLITHSFIDVGKELGLSHIHLPLPYLRKMSSCDKKFFSHIGCSCHNINEVLEAHSLGCTYVTLGHIFPTDCKRGLTPKGIDFLENAINNSPVPIYALGGIDESNFHQVINTGVKGIAMMSSLMKCKNVNLYVKQFNID